jgi:NhaA family Na+:H+ antiporter
VYVPIALTTWSLVYLSGVHATVAGVALGLLTRCRPDPEEDESPAERLEHRLRPLSAGVAVPLFALVSAGVAIQGGRELLRDPIVVGIVLGMVLGKTIGVFGGAWLATRLTRAELAPGIHWRDIVAVATLSGVGFTVSLLIAELAFGGEQVAAAKTAVLAGSLLAGVVAAVLLRRRSEYHESQAGS